VRTAQTSIAERMWQRASPAGFIGGGSERRIARVTRGAESSTVAGVEGLVVLKTRGSAFEGFPRDELTTLPEAADRVLATAIGAEWPYDQIPEDTYLRWGLIRTTLLDRFLEDWSASVQHQGYQMARAALAVAPEIPQITIRMPNQHHLPFDLSRFGMEDRGIVFHPVSEPFGDISLTVTR
jgi:urate oxidase